MKMRVAIVLTVALQFVSATWSLAHPGSGIAVDEEGQVYFTDTGEGVWKVDAKGVVSLFSKSALHWMAYHKEGSFARASEKFGCFERITPTGSKPVLLLCSDFPCAFGNDGNLYYAETRERTRIIRRTRDGKESVLAGGIAQAPVFRGVTGITAGPDDSLYIVELDQASGDHAVLKIAMDGKVSTFSSGFLNTFESDRVKGGNYCRGLVVHTDGTVFVAATDRRCIVKITPQGKTSLALRATSPWSPTGVTIFRDELYTLEYSDMPSAWNLDDRKGWVPRVRKVDRMGNVITVATVPRQEVILQAR